MPRLSIASIALAIILASYSCSKDATGVTLLAGTWVKGTRAGDTLYFIRKDNKNILRYNGYFNAAFPVYIEAEYAYQNDKLVLRGLGVGADLREIDSFTWIKKGETFEVLGYQLYSILSSTQTKFTYQKIR